MNISPSQIEMFEDCERRWYFKSPLHIKEPQNKYAARGSGLHSKNDLYLKTGQLPDVKDPDYRLVLAGTAILPKPGPDLVVEAPVQMATWPDGPLFVGFMDLVHARGGVPTYVDHKSIGKTKNTKTSIELLHNTQLMTYARSLWHLAPDFTFAGPKSRIKELEASKQQFLRLQAFVAEWSHADVVRIQHAYIHTKNKKKTAWTREVVVERESVELFWEKKLVVMRAMAAILTDHPVSLETVQLLRGNPDSCDKYPPDGCPYRAQCGFTNRPGSRFRGVARGLVQLRVVQTEGAMMGLAEKIAESKAKKAAADAQVAAGALPPPAVQPKLEGVVPAAPPPTPTPPAVPAVVATGIVPPDAVVEQWACIKCEAKVFEVEPGTYMHPKANHGRPKCVHDDRKALTRKDVYPWKSKIVEETGVTDEEPEDEEDEDDAETKPGPVTQVAAPVAAAAAPPPPTTNGAPRKGKKKDKAVETPATTPPPPAAPTLDAPALDAAFKAKVAELMKLGLPQVAAEAAAKSVVEDEARMKAAEQARADAKAAQEKFDAEVLAAKAAEAAKLDAKKMTPLEEAKAAAIITGSAEEVARPTCNFIGCGRGLIATPEGPNATLWKCPAHGNPDPIKVLPVFKLLIGTIAIKGPAKDYVLLEDWLAPIVEELAHDLQLATHRLVDFSKGGAHLQTYVRDYILGGGEVPKVLVVQSAYEADAKDVLAVLTPYASEIFKGI